MKHLRSIGLFAMIAASCLLIAANQSKLQQFVDDPQFQDEVIDYIVVQHRLMNKLLEKIMMDENKRQMVIRPLSQNAGNGSAGTKSDIEKSGESPYRSYENRPVKSLSQDQVQSYLEGMGMGFALPAELNHYPGPKHVLDLASQLHLSEDQKEQSGQLFTSMHSKAVELGRKIVDDEQALDASFAKGTIDKKTLKDITSSIAVAQGELRFTHLQTHLAMKKLLSEEQVKAYDGLRGYIGTGNPANHEHKH